MLTAFVGQAALTAATFYPLVPGNHWTYKDDGAPASVFETVVRKEVVPPPAPPDEGGDVVKPYYPVDDLQDGQVTGTSCYRQQGATMYYVGSGLNHPVTARPVLIATRAPSTWDYYGNPLSALEPDSIHYSAKSEMGPKESVLGKMHDTLIIHMHVELGKGSSGIDVHEDWCYAADVGLYKLVEKGHVGKRELNHTRTLVKFEAGGAS